MLSLALVGIEAGIYVSGLIHDHRMADLSATQYTAMHQMRDKTFRKVMPVLGLATFGLLLFSTAVGLAPGVPRFLGAAAVLLLLLDIAVTLGRQLPLNHSIQTWTEATIPGDWADVRDRWALHHRVRSFLGLAAYACFLVAVVLTVAR